MSSEVDWTSIFSLIYVDKDKLRKTFSSKKSFDKILDTKSPDVIKLKRNKWTAGLRESIYILDRDNKRRYPIEPYRGSENNAQITATDGENEENIGKSAGQQDFKVFIRQICPFTYFLEEVEAVFKLLISCCCHDNEVAKATLQEKYLHLICDNNEELVSLSSSIKVKAEVSVAELLKTLQSIDTFVLMIKVLANACDLNRYPNMRDWYRYGLKQRLKFLTPQSHSQVILNSVLKTGKWCATFDSTAGVNVDDIFSDREAQMLITLDNEQTKALYLCFGMNPRTKGGTIRTLTEKMADCGPSQRTIYKVFVGLLNYYLFHIPLSNDIDLVFNFWFRYPSRCKLQKESIMWMLWELAKYYIRNPNSNAYGLGHSASPTTTRPVQVVSVDDDISSVALSTLLSDDEDGTRATRKHLNESDDRNMPERKRTCTGNPSNDASFLADTIESINSDISHDEEIKPFDDDEDCDNDLKDVFEGDADSCDETDIENFFNDDVLSVKEFETDKSFLKDTKICGLFLNSKCSNRIF